MIKKFEKFQKYNTPTRWETFDKWNGKDDKYYIIHIEKSFINFQIALDKIGCTEEFEDDWGVVDYNYDITEDNMEYFGLDSIYLILSRNIIGNFHVTIRGIEDDTNIDDAVYGGTVNITDKDIEEYNFNKDVNKSNL